MVGRLLILVCLFVSLADGQMNRKRVGGCTNCITDTIKADTLDAFSRDPSIGNTLEKLSDGFGHILVRYPADGSQDTELGGLIFNLVLGTGYTIDSAKLYLYIDTLQSWESGDSIEVRPDVGLTGVRFDSSHTHDIPTHISDLGLTSANTFEPVVGGNVIDVSSGISGVYANIGELTYRVSFQLVPTVGGDLDGWNCKILESSNSDPNKRPWIRVWYTP